jgi:methylated-DNA-protein-cysteine methyltransferase-like protein
MSDQSFDVRRARAQVYALVRACPPGRVTTYGWLASAIGLPGHARLVGWIMNGTPAEAQVPAQRVINSQGVLTGAWAFGHPDTMAGLLRAEGVAFDAKGRVVMKAHAWDPLADLAPDELQHILANAPSEFAALPDPKEDLPAMLRRDLSSPFKVRPPKAAKDTKENAPDDSQSRLDLGGER